MEALPVYRIDQFLSEKGDHDFYANALPAHLRDHHFINTPHKHNFYLCILFTAGTGVHEVDFIKYRIKPGSIFFLSPGQMHNWKMSADADGFIFFHSGNFYDLHFNNRKVQDFPFFQSIYNSAVLYINKAETEQLTFLYKELLKEYLGGQFLKQALLCSLADQIYIRLARLYIPGKKAQENNRYMAYLRKLEMLINENFKEIKSPSAYAGMMNMSGKHLNRICQVCLQKTVSEMIADRVILEAKRILVHADRTVAETALELGFPEQSYFNRLFKKNTGETPLQFVRKYNQ